MPECLVVRSLAISGLRPSSNNWNLCIISECLLKTAVSTLAWAHATAVTEDGEVSSGTGHGQFKFASSVMHTPDIMVSTYSPQRLLLFVCVPVA